MKTVNGIYTNIEESDYKYNFLNYDFYFSSLFYLEKFRKEINQFIKFESQKIYTKYRSQINLTNLDLFLALSLYKRIEKRGYKVINADGINILR